MRANQKGKSGIRFFIYRNRATDPTRFEGKGWGEREVVTILTYFRMTGLGLVSCLDASHGGYSIVTRPSLKENKNSFAVLLYGSRNLCAGQIVSDLSARRGGEGSLDIKETIWSSLIEDFAIDFSIIRKFLHKFLHDAYPCSDSIIFYVHASVSTLKWTTAKIHNSTQKKKIIKNNSNPEYL